MYLNMCWQTHPIKAITENASQHLNTKPFASQGRQKSISTCDNQTLPPWQWGHKMHLIKCWQNTSIASEDTKHISTRFNKPIPWQRGHKMNLNLCWPNPSNENENTKCIPTCVEQTHPNTARTQSASHQTSPMTVRTQTGFNICWPNTSHACEDTKISKYPDQIYSTIARTRNAFQHVLSTSLPYQRTHKGSWRRGHKIQLNISWPKPFLASEHTKSSLHPSTPPTTVSTQNYLKLSWLKTHPITARTQNASELV